MGYSNGKISFPVNQYDVQRALGTTHDDWGMLCTHAGINKWARFKPINVIGVEEVPYNTGDRSIVRNHFGLDLIRATDVTLAQFASMVGNYAQFVYGAATTGTYVGWSDGVKHIKPTGSNYAYRITDFGCIENSSFGYLSSAQCQWRQAGSSTRGIGSDINTLVSYEGLDKVIDLSGFSQGDYQDLSNDNDVLSAVNLQVNIANQTSQEFNSVSAVELLCSYGVTSGVTRGVIITDVSGFVGYTAIETVPWGQWASTQNETLLYGEWCYFEFYTNAASETGRADYWLIPMFEDKVMFTYGSYTSYLVFIRDEGSGHVEYQSSLGKYAMYIGFAEITGQNLNDWYLTVKVIKKYSDGTSAVYQTYNISNMSSYTSGYKWYYAWVGIDLGTIDNYGDSFCIEFYGRRRTGTESDRTLFTINYITLTA